MVNSINFWMILITGIATEMSVWDGVVVSPHERAYIKPEKKESDDNSMDTEAVASKWMD